MSLPNQEGIYNYINSGTPRLNRQLRCEVLEPRIENPQLFFSTRLDRSCTGLRLGASGDAFATRVGDGHTLVQIGGIVQPNGRRLSLTGRSGDAIRQKRVPPDLGTKFGWRVCPPRHHGPDPPPPGRAEAGMSSPGIHLGNQMVETVVRKIIVHLQHNAS